MKNHKHTPGPWSYNMGTEIKGCDKVIRVANVNHSMCDDKTVIANARLISAAPEMLEALERIVIRLVELGEDFNAETLICQNAIEKARGES